MTDLTVGPALRAACDIRYNYNHTGLPWDDCVFEVIDKWELSGSLKEDDSRAALIERLVELGPVTASVLAPIIQEELDRV